MPAGLHPSLRAVGRATRVLPSIVGAGAAVTVMLWAAASHQADPAGPLVAALLLSTGAVGFALDDDSAVTLASSPSTLRRRRTMAAAFGVAPIAVAGGAVVVVLHSSWPQHINHLAALAAEVTALALLTLAMAARWGGAAASFAAPTTAVLLSVLATRITGLPTLLPDSPWQDRWGLVAAAALGWFLIELRDPAQRPIRDSWRPLGRGP